jgi:hypothetical protein
MLRLTALTMVQLFLTTVTVAILQGPTGVEGIPGVVAKGEQRNWLGSVRNFIT